MELREEFRYELERNGSVKIVCYRDAESNEAWRMTAGQLRMNPQYYTTIHTYADTLPAGQVRNAFYYDCTLEGWDNAMRTNMGGGLSITGFYEMKQEVYEFFHRNRR